MSQVEGIKENLALPLGSCRTKGLMLKGVKNSPPPTPRPYPFVESAKLALVGVNQLSTK